MRSPWCLTVTTSAIFLREELGNLCSKGTQPRNSTTAKQGRFLTIFHTHIAYPFWKAITFSLPDSVFISGICNGTSTKMDSNWKRADETPCSKRLDIYREKIINRFLPKPTEFLSVVSDEMISHRNISFYFKKVDLLDVERAKNTYKKN